MGISTGRHPQPLKLNVCIHVHVCERPFTLNCLVHISMESFGELGKIFDVKIFKTPLLPVATRFQVNLMLNMVTMSGIPAITFCRSAKNYRSLKIF